MKLFTFLLMTLLILSCQKESLVFEEDTQDENTVIDSELSRLMLSVSAHDGSFDDTLDNAGCFSVKFPYTIIYNGTTVIINSINDILGIPSGQDVVFQFPIEIIFSDYTSTTINSAEELNSARVSCASNQTFLTSIKCVDFVYPIKIATFNSDTNRFNILVIDHDQENFRTVTAILEEQLAEIRFPLSLQLANDEFLEINSSQELKQFIYLYEESCE